MGGIDIGGIPGRFGPQTSADLVIKQGVIGGEYSFVTARGSHLIKGGALVEHYKDDLYNPTFSLGIYTFGNLEGFLRNTPIRFVGLTPEASLERLWKFTLFGAYLQDEFRASDRFSVHAGLRYEMTTLPKDAEGRDSTLVTLSDTTPTLGQPYGKLAEAQLLAPGEFRLGREGRRQTRGPRRLRPVLQRQQPAEPDRDHHESAGDASGHHREPDLSPASLRPGLHQLDPARAVGPRESARPRLQPERAEGTLGQHGADRGLRGLASASICSAAAT